MAFFWGKNRTKEDIERGKKLEEIIAYLKQILNLLDGFDDVTTKEKFKQKILDVHNEVSDIMDKINNSLLIVNTGDFLKQNYHLRLNDWINNIPPRIKSLETYLNSDFYNAKDILDRVEPIKTIINGLIKQLEAALKSI